MSDMNLLQEIASVGLVVGTVGVLVFTVLYGLRSAWYRSDEGRALFSKSASLVSISGFVAAAIIFENWPGMDIIRVAIYGAYAVTSWWFVGVLIRVQHRTQVKTDALVKELREARAREAEAVETRDTEPVAVIIKNQSPVRVRSVKLTGPFRGFLRWLRRLFG